MATQPPPRAFPPSVRVRSWWFKEMVSKDPEEKETDMSLECFSMSLAGGSFRPERNPDTYADTL